MDYALVFHLTKDGSKTVSIDVKSLCALVHAQPYNSPLVSLCQQVDEQLQPSWVFENPRGYNLAVKVNVFAHNFLVFCLLNECWFYDIFLLWLCDCFFNAEAQSREDFRVASKETTECCFHR